MCSFHVAAATSVLSRPVEDRLNAKALLVLSPRLVANMLGFASLTYNCRPRQAAPAFSFGGLRAFRFCAAASFDARASSQNRDMSASV